ncbi:hypothetical protein SVAN01_02841 [Stagonosporopsis vannaccii]|nr:hypothetical protein SVAN01_02841 [Stagonosporopsis vannaccii]
MLLALNLGQYACQFLDLTSGIISESWKTYNTKIRHDNERKHVPGLTEHLYGSMAIFEVLYSTREERILHHLTEVTLSSRPWNAFEDVSGHGPHIRVEELASQDTKSFMPSQFASNSTYSTYNDYQQATPVSRRGSSTKFARSLRKHPRVFSLRRTLFLKGWKVAKARQPDKHVVLFYPMLKIP